MEKDKLNNNWRLTENKTSKKKRRKRQVIVFILFIILVIIACLGIYIYNKFISNTNIQESILENNQVTDVKEEKNNKEKIDEVFSIKDKDFYLYEDVGYENSGIKLLEYDNSHNNYASIYYICYDYTSDPSIFYSLEIKDNDGNPVTLNEINQPITEQVLIAGMVTEAKIKKVDFNTKLTFSIYEKNDNTNQILNQAEVEIDLSKDLEPKQKIKNDKPIKEDKIGDIRFKYPETEFYQKTNTSHGFSKILTGESVSIEIDIQYGNRKSDVSHIEFSRDKNVNNLNLKEAYEALELITEKLGNFGISDVYGLGIKDESGAVTQQVEVTFSEMLTLAKGGKINKSGKSYTKNDFDVYASMEYHKQDEVTIGEDIPAIQYSRSLDDEYDSYIFIYKDNIYYLNCPKNERCKEEIEAFLNSLVKE